MVEPGLLRREARIEVAERAAAPELRHDQDWLQRVIVRNAAPR
jgi:hypothetical protein